MIPPQSPAINGRVKRISTYALAFSLVWAPFAAAQPDATTDVDEDMTAAEQSPLAPDQAQLSKPLTLDDLLAGVAPYQPPAAPKPVAAAPAPAAPAVVRTAPATATAQAVSAPAEPRPIFIEDRGVTPDAPPTQRDIAYEQRVLGVFTAAQGKQGALDGRWRVIADGVEVYILQFTDPGAGESRVEGAWRNVRRTGGLDASGFVDQVSREDDEVVIRFTDANRRSSQVRLRNTPDGAWTGHIVGPEGRTNVVMVRDVSVEALALGVPTDTLPQPPAPARAAPAPGRNTAPATNNRRPSAR